MYSLFRQLLFKLPTEAAHNLSLTSMDLAAQLRLGGLIAEQRVCNSREVMGIRFPNPVGLAAGLDKNADHILGLASLGFGFLELGTVTPLPQPGNPRPRLFRLPEQQAIINRMGFNNLGVDYLVEKVEKSDFTGVLGINIGKNKDTPLENAVDDYLICMRKVYPVASYITVNLSSPNTPGLRDLQFGEPLLRLLTSLKTHQQQLQVQHSRRVPLVVKIAPDMSPDDLGKVAEALVDTEMDGVIATNTTIEREGLEGVRHSEEAGGLSGAPLRQRSTAVIRQLAETLDGKLPIIGVGGIMDGQSAVEKIDAGAELVQLYSGLIYRGPKLIAEANKAILDASVAKKSD